MPLRAYREGRADVASRPLATDIVAQANFGCGGQSRLQGPSVPRLVGDSTPRRLDPIWAAMSVTRELRRRVSADRSLPRFEPCLPLSANVFCGWPPRCKR